MPSIRKFFYSFDFGFSFYDLLHFEDIHVIIYLSSRPSGDRVIYQFPLVGRKEHHFPFRARTIHHLLFQMTR